MSINKWEKWNFEIIPRDISERWSYSWLITVWPIVIPWAPEVFLVCGGNFRCWPKTDTSSAPSSRAGHYKDLTETENRARKVSGTQGSWCPAAKRKRKGFVNIVNTNTFLFIPVKKLSESYAYMDSHDATFEYSKCYYRGGLQFFGHTFLYGAGVLGC